MKYDDGKNGESALIPQRQDKEIEISVIMAVYNTNREYLVSAVESILNQSFNKFEFIIIDDKSTDGSLAVLREYQKKDSRIRIIENPENIGLTKSLNKGLAAARGKYIARMDADDISLPDRLKKQYEYMERNPDTCVLGTYTYTEGKSKLAVRGYNRNQEILRIQVLFRNAGVAHPTAFIRKSFLKINNIKYDEAIRKSQDYALWVDCVRCGGKIDLLPHIFLIYRIHDGQISSNRSDQRDYADLVKEKALKYFVGDCSAETVKTHCSIFGEKVLGCKEDYVEHLDMLQRTNCRLGKYNEIQFRRQMNAIWLHICYRRLRNSRKCDFVLSKRTLSSLAPMSLYTFYLTFMRENICYRKARLKFIRDSEMTRTTTALEK